MNTVSKVLLSILMLLLTCTVLMAAGELPKKEDITPATGKEGGQEPIQVTSDKLEANTRERWIKFLGNVVAKRGQMTLYSDELLVKYRPEEKAKGEKRTAGDVAGSLGQGSFSIEEVVAKGNVKVVDGDRIVEGKKAVYYGKDGKIVITGDPVIKQGEDCIFGSKIIILLNENRSIVEGGPEKRVKAKIYPPMGQQGP